MAWRNAIRRGISGSAEIKAALSVVARDQGRHRRRRQQCKPYLQQWSLLVGTGPKSENGRSPGFAIDAERRRDAFAFGIDHLKRQPHLDFIAPSCLVVGVLACSPGSFRRSRRGERGRRQTVNAHAEVVGDRGDLTLESVIALLVGLERRLFHRLALLLHAELIRRRSSSISRGDHDFGLRRASQLARIQRSSSSPFSGHVEQRGAFDAVFGNKRAP